MYKVVLGESNRSVTEESEQVIDVEVIYPHPRFSEVPKVINDIALLKLRTAAEETSWVQPLEEGTREILTGEKCVVLGWGQHTSRFVDEGQYGNGTYLPMAGELQLADHDTCKQAYEEVTAVGIDDNVFCFKPFHPNTSVGACQGDSGGPLVCENPENPSQTHVDGIVSVGVGCGSKLYADIFVRLSAFTDWIEQTIEMHERENSVFSLSE